MDQGRHHGGGDILLKTRERWGKAWCEYLWKRIPCRIKGKCKGPVAGMCLACSGKVSLAVPQAPQPLGTCHICVCAKHRRKRSSINVVLNEWMNEWASFLEEPLPTAHRCIFLFCSLPKGISGPALISWWPGTATLQARIFPNLLFLKVFSQFLPDSLLITSTFLFSSPSRHPWSPHGVPIRLPVLRDTNVSDAAADTELSGGQRVVAACGQGPPGWGDGVRARGRKDSEVRGLTWS